MLTIEQIKDRLKDRNIAAVAEHCGISAASIYRLVNDQASPRYETVKVLSDYLERNP